MVTKNAVFMRSVAFRKRLLGTIIYEVINLNEDFFPTRLNTLRTKTGISARDMSLSLGQNPGYINNIENKKALPSMTMFFYICEFLKISPRDFFDETIQDPQEYYEFIDNIKDLSPQQLHHISEIIKDLIKSNK